MIIDFKQGIITYPSSGNLQRFLTYDSGYVTLSTADGRTDVAFAHGSENYLHTESTSVTNAWGPITPSVDAWLYWDIDTLTAVRTFGVTYLQPGYGAVLPEAASADQHWFNTTTNQMMVYRSGKWIAKIRVFACKINSQFITPLGNNPAKPFAGTQVGISVPGIAVGRIIVDSTGTPIRRSNGEIFTSEDEFFVNGSPVNTIRLEANILNATARESIARYQVVKFTEFGQVNLATYDDEQTAAIAMSMEDLVQSQTGTLCMQGVVTNPAWNWTHVGAPLYVHGSIPGLLVEYDPHVQDAGTYQTGKPPVARVITPTSIFFDQGLGGKGDRGENGIIDVPLATTTVFGISKLSVAATDPANPVVVGTNDPRNSDSRYPLPHNQAATTITTLPVGVLTGVDLQANLQLINDVFVKKTGDTMTGYLTLSADPATALHATTKHYVDTRVLDNIADVVITNPIAENVLKYDGENWINGQSAQLWTVGSHTTHNIPIPAVTRVGLANCSPTPEEFATTAQLLQTPIEIQYPQQNIPANVRLTIDGIDHIVSLPMNIGWITVGDVIPDLNTAFVGVATFEVALDPADQNQACIVVTAVDPAAGNITSMSLPMYERAADLWASNICTYAYATRPNATAVMTLGTCVLFESFTDPSVLASQTMNIPAAESTTLTLNVDGVDHVVDVQHADILPINSGSALIGFLNSKWGSYVTITASGLDNGFSGLIFTSVSPTIVSITFTDGALDMLSGSGVCVFTYPPGIDGIPLITTTKTQVLQPSSHTPTLEETYIPLHTCIESDPIIITRPYWLDALGSTVANTYLGLHSVGAVSVGTPGRAIVTNRQTDTVYVIGSYADNTITLEAHEPAGPTAGALVTDAGYSPRISFPVTVPGFTAYTTIGVKCACGGPTGNVYSLIGLNGYSHDNLGAIVYGSRVVVVATTPTLTTQLWARDISVVLDPAGVNSQDDIHIETPRSGLAVNKLTNDIFVAMQVVVVEPQVDPMIPAVVKYGVVVVKLDANGNILWSQAVESRPRTGTGDTINPPEIAIYETTGDVYVGYCEYVAKLNGLNGAIIWCTDVVHADAENNMNVTSVDVHQLTGDVFIACNEYIPTITPPTP